MRIPTGAPASVLLHTSQFLDTLLLSRWPLRELVAVG